MFVELLAGLVIGVVEVFFEIVAFVNCLERDDDMLGLIPPQDRPDRFELLIKRMLSNLDVLVKQFVLFGIGSFHQ